MGDLKPMHRGDIEQQLNVHRKGIEAGQDKGPVGIVSDDIFNFLSSREKVVSYNPKELLVLTKKLRELDIKLENLVEGKLLHQGDVDEFLKYCRKLNKLAYEGKISLSREDRESLIFITDGVGVDYFK